MKRKDDGWLLYTLALILLLTVLVWAAWFYLGTFHVVWD